MAIKKEVEVKIKLNDSNAVREKILSIGAKATGKQKQFDEYFDFSDNRIFNVRECIRVRNKTLVTYKANSTKVEGRLESDEAEFNVDNYEALIAVFTRLGLERKVVKEKIRESFEFSEAKLEIDQLPFGTYLEIEGTKEEIEEIAEKLGFSKDQFIANCYTTLYRKYCEEHKIEMKKEIIFENENNN